MFTSNPSRKVADGYMWMSGTSFAAPIVSGAAATVLSRHPDWTPDQVKGALMASANVPTGYDSIGALGVGIVEHPGGDRGRRTRQPERRAQPLRRHRPGDGAEDVRFDRLGSDGGDRPGLERGLVVERELVVGLVVERELVVGFVVERELVVGFVVERELVVGFVVEHVRGRVAAGPRMSACLRSAVDTPIGGAALLSQGR